MANKIQPKKPIIEKIDKPFFVRRSITAHHHRAKLDGNILGFFRDSSFLLHLRPKLFILIENLSGPDIGFYCYDLFPTKTKELCDVSSVTNLFLKNQVQAKFLSSTLNAFLWDNFHNYQVQKFENQVFKTNLSSTPSNSYQNLVQYLKIKCSWSH